MSRKLISGMKRVANHTRYIYTRNEKPRFYHCIYSQRPSI